MKRWLAEPPARLPGWLPDLGRPRSLVILRWAISAVLVAGLLAFVVRGANNPPDPTLAPPGTPPTQPVIAPASN
ncbi:MAG TPA: hypothetical protein VGJ03_08110 [Acidimicrobiales bacterium]